MASSIVLSIIGLVAIVWITAYIPKRSRKEWMGQNDKSRR